MNEPAQISLSFERATGSPHILPVMFSSKRMPAKYLLSFLSGDHCDFIFFDDKDQANLLVRFSRTNRV